tara:strand:- start:457 stop:738 length:282 start_codon:yes stop_codon:yes gene_type:complete
MLQTKTVDNVVRQSSTHKFVYVIQFNNGKYGCGSANNPARTIASINSGHHSLVKEKLSVFRIVGIKEITPDRNLITTVQSISARAGDNNVIAL